MPIPIHLNETRSIRIFILVANLKVHHVRYNSKKEGDPSVIHITSLLQTVDPGILVLPSLPLGVNPWSSGVAQSKSFGISNFCVHANHLI